MSLPKQAGVLNPSDVLQGHRKYVFDNLSALLPCVEEPLEDTYIRPCHMVDPKEEAEVLRCLHSRDMIVMVEASKIPKTSSGRAVKGVCLVYQIKISQIV